MSATREPRVVQRPAQPYLAVAREVTNGVTHAVDGAFPELFGWLRARTVDPAGPPLIRVGEIDHEGAPLTLEVGVPVAPGARGDDHVLVSELPAGRYATLLHVGPYRSATMRDIADARLALVRWTTRRGLVYSRETPRGATLACCVDHLRVGPDTERDHMRWETELAYLILAD